MEKLKKYNTLQCWENAYLVLMGMIISYRFIQTTMFAIPGLSKIGLLLYFFMMCYTVGKLLVFRQIYSKQDLLMSAVILVGFVGAALISGYSFLIELAFLIVGAKGVSFRKMLKVFLTVGITITLAAFIASRVGWIENLVYPSVRGGVRQSFGSVYPTDFSAHIFYFVLSWLYISHEWVKAYGKCKKGYIYTGINLLVILIAMAFVYTQCGAYTTTASLFLTFVGYGILCIATYRKKTMSNRWKIVSWTPVALAALFIGMASLYNEAVAVWQKLDQLLSLRLSYSSQGIRQYGFRLFGQFVEEIGNGGNINTRENYFFLDDSYIRIAMEYGIIMLLLVLLICILISNRAVKEQKGILFLIMFLMEVHCFMEQHLLEVAFQIFILCLFADWSEKQMRSKTGE